MDTACLLYGLVGYCAGAMLVGLVKGLWLAFSDAKDATE